LSKFDELKTLLAEASNNGEYAQARIKEVVERLEHILEKIEEAKRSLCFKEVEQDFDKLMQTYKTMTDMAIESGVAKSISEAVKRGEL